MSRVPWHLLQESAGSERRVAAAIDATPMARGSNAALIEAFARK
jgi:hypothetical protein